MAATCRPELLKSFAILLLASTVVSADSGGILARPLFLCSKLPLSKPIAPDTADGVSSRREKATTIAPRAVLEAPSLPLPLALPLQFRRQPVIADGLQQHRQFTCVEVPAGVVATLPRPLVEMRRSSSVSGGPFFMTSVGEPHDPVSPPQAPVSLVVTPLETLPATETADHKEPQQTSEKNVNSHLGDQATPTRPETLTAEDPVSTHVETTTTADLTTTETTSTALLLKQPASTRPLSKPPHVPHDIEYRFQQQLVNACENAYPDISIRDVHSTPYRHSNCSVLCIYDLPPVTIPEGGMCYLQINYIGTLGTCDSDGNCVIEGSPFGFDIPDHRRVRLITSTPREPALVTPLYEKRYPPRRR